MHRVKGPTCRGRRRGKTKRSWVLDDIVELLNLPENGLTLGLLLNEELIFKWVSYY